MACLREMRNTYGCLVGKSEGRSHLENLRVDGSILLKCKINKMGGMDWIDVAQDRENWPAVFNTCNEPSDLCNI